MEVLIPVVVVVTVLVACYYFLKSTADTSILPSIQDGKKEFSYTQKIQESSNQPGGLQFSYTAWIRIDDFTYRFGTQKIIFVKGNDTLTTACPALVIDANTNTLMVIVDTFGTQETIPIVSVPARKWLHIAIVVNQETIDVYIDGISYAHHILSQLPRQNSGSLMTSPKGGFAGKIVSLEYYPRSLTTSDVLKLAAQAPPISSEKGTQVLPPYFDFSWFRS